MAKGCNLANETNRDTSIKFFTKDQRNEIKKCNTEFIVDTNITFTLKRTKSRHKSKLVYWRQDIMEEEVFDFGTSSIEIAPSSDIHFDGRNLICKKIDGVQEDCNELPVNEQVPIILFSLEVSPRETEFYGDTDDLRWERNRYSLHGSNYNIKCKGFNLKFIISVLTMN